MKETGNSTNFQHLFKFSCKAKDSQFIAGPILKKGTWLIQATQELLVHATASTLNTGTWRESSKNI